MHVPRRATSTRTHLVTGGAGFVGSSLVGRLLARGDRVVVLDDLSTGRLDGLPLDDARLEFVHGSVLDAPLVASLAARVDQVFHLAAVVGLAEIERRPGATARVSIEGTEAVVAAVGASPRVRGVLFTSSSEVYRDGPFSEDRAIQLEPDDGRGGYAWAKWLAEERVAMLAEPRTEGSDPRTTRRVVIARLFNTVGPRQASAQGLVLARWRAELATGRPLTLFGDGRQTRCFAHVDDVCCVLERLALGPAAARAGEAILVNVGWDQPVSVLEAARRVAGLVGRAGGGVAIERRPFAAVYGERFRDPRHRRPDLRRLRALLGGELRFRDFDAIVRDVFAGASSSPVASDRSTV
jgi:UDP-glucose 4-epimerase